MLRIAITAKEFGQKPSSYMPDISSYEAFCFDEACAHYLIKAREKARKEHDGEGEAKQNKAPTSKGPVSFEWLMNKQEQLKQTGRYR